MSKAMKVLKEKREAKFMTQEDLAEAAGLSRRTIVNAEKGRGVSLHTFKTIAKALKIKAEDLL